MKLPKSRLPKQYLIACVLMVVCGVVVAAVGHVTMAQDSNQVQTLFSQVSEKTMERMSLDREVKRTGSDDVTRAGHVRDVAKLVASDADSREQYLPDVTWPDAKGMWEVHTSYERKDGSAKAIWLCKADDGSCKAVVVASFDFDKDQFKDATVDVSPLPTAMDTF